MSDIELVIKISNYDKEWITNGYCIPEEINTRIAESIANGTPLPKGYGDLIDRKELLKHSYRIDDSATLSTRDVVNVEEIVNAPTIIEADKESEI